MGLDIRTMILMAAALSMLLAGLMTLAGLHSGNIRGVRQWASANLLYGIGLILAFTPFSQSHWLFVTVNPLIAIAVGLQITGIQAFEERTSDWRIPIALAVASLIINFATTILTFNIALRIIGNSLLIGTAFAVCARSLLIRIDPPLRTAYWLTGSAFLMLTLLAYSRIFFVIGDQPQFNFLLRPEPINLMMFSMFSCMLLLISFGFVLMLNYRLSVDLERLAARDSLTNALNRRSLEQVGHQLQAHFSRSGGSLALLMLDIDHFKQVNDQHGHPVGDAVLQLLAEIAHRTIRTGDYFARYGGEEFCILLPGTTELDACILADRLRQAFSETEIDCGKGISVKSTVSIGVTDSQFSGMPFEDMVKDADHALYHAKQSGRNRVVAASSLINSETQLSSVTPALKELALADSR